MGRLQSETISLHVTPEEKKAMVERMKEAVSPSMRAFILDMCMNGKIIVKAITAIVFLAVAGIIVFLTINEKLCYYLLEQMF